MNTLILILIVPINYALFLIAKSMSGTFDLRLWMIGILVMAFLLGRLSTANSHLISIGLTSCVFIDLIVDVTVRGIEYNLWPIAVFGYAIWGTIIWVLCLLGRKLRPVR